MVFSQLQPIFSRFPNNIAIAEGNERVITFSALERAIYAAEEKLNACGFKMGHKLLIASPNCIDLISIFYAVARIGGIFIPVDPILSRKEFHIMVQETNCDIILLNEKMLSKYPDWAEQNKFEKKLSFKYDPFYVHYLSFEPEYIGIGNKLNSLFAKNSVKNEYEVKDLEFFHLYSSGSSGKPKGARLTQKNIFYQCKIWADNMGVLPSDKFLCGLPISHSHGLTVTFPSLMSGASVYYVDAMHLVPPRVFDYIEQHGITLMSGVPYFFKVLLNYPQDIRSKIKTLRMAICGSAPMAEILGHQFLEKFGLHIHQAFGISEIGIICLNHMDEKGSKYGSVGKVFKEFEYKIVDESNQICNVGERGHFLVKSPGLALGYSNANEEEKKMFVDGWFHTQDVVEEDEYGQIFVIGRKSNFINVNGNKVFPAEVEKVILGLEAVKDCAVMGHTDEDAGELVRAFIVPSSIITVEEIRNHCLKHLTSYKIPRIIDIVEELPHSSTGKIMYNKIDKSNININQEMDVEDEDLLVY